MKYEKTAFVYKVEESSTELDITAGIFEAEGGVSEYHLLLTLVRTGGEFAAQVEAIHKGLGKLLLDKGWGENSVVYRRYFLSDAANQTEILSSSLTKEAGRNISVIQQAPANGSKIALWVYGQFGHRKEERYFRHFWTTQSRYMGGNSEQQTDFLLTAYNRELLENQCAIGINCIRTWFFVRDIDVNYAGVVKARRTLFGQWGLNKDTHYIASTGIEGRSADPRSCVMLEAYAVSGLKPEQVSYLYALSHLNPTWEYGVTFERGVSILYGDRRQAYISGTASIDNKGNIVGRGDIVKQVFRMWENVEALLKEGGYVFEDVCQMIIYLRDSGDYITVKRLFDERFPRIPRVIVLAAVCRSGWLVEMECIALKKQHNPEFRNFE